MLRGILLGALAEASYEEAEMRLEPGDILVLYTDGLIERRDVALDECLDHLCAAVTDPPTDLEELLDHLLAN